MAQSLETLRHSAVSIRGRRLMIDRNDFLIAKPTKQIIEDVTTGSSGTTQSNHGISRVTATGSSQGPVQVPLAAPEPGVEKTLVLGTSSTASYQFLTTPAGAAVMHSSAGTTAGVINLLGPGAVITLIGVTTALWQVKSEGGYNSTGMGKNVSFTTST